MNTVIIETYEQREDIRFWCYEHIGKGSVGRTIRDDCVWSYNRTFSTIEYVFKNPAAATLFKLKWF